MSQRSLANFSEPGGSPRNKRRRIDLEFVQDPDLWLSDGNIIIVAPDDSQESDSLAHAFRVHKSVLAKHSPVLDDLFKLPQGLDAEVHEGVPIVRLTDSSSDVRDLLRMFYDPAYASVPSSLIVIDILPQ